MMRVLPRDAFNDANLLKCIGQLTLLTEDGLIPWLTLEYDGEPFDIQQDENSGETYVANIELITREGRILSLRRPMNSRDHWPLYCHINDEVYPVFSNGGNFILKEEDCK